MIISYMDVIIKLTKKETEYRITLTERRILDKLIEWFDFDIENSKE